MFWGQILQWFCSYFFRSHTPCFLRSPSRLISILTQQVLFMFYILFVLIRIVCWISGGWDTQTVLLRMFIFILILKSTLTFPPHTVVELLPPYVYQNAQDAYSRKLLPFPLPSGSKRLLQTCMSHWADAGSCVTESIMAFRLPGCILANCD